MKSGLQATSKAQRCCHLTSAAKFSGGLNHCLRRPLIHSIEELSRPKGDWGRVLVSFRQDSDQVQLERSWFSGIGLDARQLSALSQGLGSRVRLDASLGKKAAVQPIEDGFRVVQDGSPTSLWTIDGRTQHVRAQDSTWRLEATLMELQVLPPGSCRCVPPH